MWRIGGVSVSGERVMAGLFSLLAAKACVAGGLCAFDEERSGRRWEGRRVRDAFIEWAVMRVQSQRTPDAPRSDHMYSSAFLPRLHFRSLSFPALRYLSLLLV